MAEKERTSFLIPGICIVLIVAAIAAVFLLPIANCTFPTRMFRGFTSRHSTGVRIDGRVWMWECRGCGGDWKMTFWEKWTKTTLPENHSPPLGAIDVTERYTSWQGG